MVIIVMLFLSGCYKPGPGAKPWQVSGLEMAYDATMNPEVENSVPTVTPTLPQPGTTPTPNQPIQLPTPRNETVSYTIQLGDTLRRIAQQYQVSVDEISTLNEMVNPDLIEVGQVILIPPPSMNEMASSFKIIPDSELVNSPSNAYFSVDDFVQAQAGYLAAYSEEVDGKLLSGSEVVNRVAVDYSVNPRLLLAILEYQSEWLTEKIPSAETLVYPLRYFDAWREGLYKQLAFAANLLNEGYYLWKINTISVWILSDGSVVIVDPTINPGTAGVINLMRYLTYGTAWEKAISDEGVFSTFYRLFGYPFNLAHEPVVPDDLAQPDLQLPFEENSVWSFTGGPHGGWDTGSAWAALDFAPPGEAMGCFPSEAWVVASAPGQIVYSDHGAVIQDLDGDGTWQIGWSILYMHIDPVDRVAVGEVLNAGDRIGHPSCEGGFSTGTHLHIARRYNGEWISADSTLPFVLDGWKSVGDGVEYDGYLEKENVTLEAWNGRSTLNAIER